MMKILVVESKGSFYGINIGNISRILEYQPTTRVPGLPGCFAGVINYSGEIWAIADLDYALTGEYCSENIPDRKIILLNNKRGLLIERIHDIKDLDESEIQSVSIDGINTTVINKGKQIICLIDIEELLNKNEKVDKISTSNECSVI